jgi:IMP dehydrogenase
VQFLNNTQNTFPLALSFDDVLLQPQYSEISSRSEVDLTTKISPNLTLKIPLIATNMDTITGPEMAIKMHQLGGMAVLARFKTLDWQLDAIKQVAQAGAVAAISIGVKPGSLERAEQLVAAGATVLDIDVAHGHMKQTLQMATALKNKFGKHITLFGGIAATGACANDLFKAGADSVMMGVGGGSICTTRIQTGSGIPTFASILEASKIARRHKKTIVPLAGIRNSGDMVKALAAGASAIRGGNIFAGSDETPGEIVEINGKKYKSYNGSTSEKEKIDQITADGAGKSAMYTKHIEGVEGLVEYKGPVEEIVTLYLAGIKSGLSYSGAKNITKLWENARFVQVTGAGVKENGAHDVIVQTNGAEKLS